MNFTGRPFWTIAKSIRAYFGHTLNMPTSDSDNFPKPKGIVGFTYVAKGIDLPMENAKAGQLVEIKNRRPPWIVVDHKLESVIIPSGWPGRLWQVDVLDAVTEAEGGKLVPNVWYTRAVAVRVLAELPVWRLFGEEGEAVCSIIAQASRLELTQVNLLANARHPDAAKVFSRAWNNWLTRNSPASEHRRKDHSGVLEIGFSDKRSSPINGGFCVLLQEIGNRAHEIEGASAFIVDEDGEDSLNPTCAVASHSLLDAAMAFGAPNLLSEEDREVLTAAWRSVFGSELG